MNIGKRIDEVRVELGLTKTEVWKPCGLTSGVYSQWLNGMELSGENLIKVAKILKVNPQWLVNGKGNKYLNEDISIVGLPQPNQDEYLSNSISLPILNTHLSMGSGNKMNNQEPVVEVLRVSKSWINKTLGKITSLNNLVFDHGVGESMSGTYDDGDILLVDIGVTEVSVDGGVYVLVVDGHKIIRRIRRTAGGMIEITSDNPAIKTGDLLNKDHPLEIKGRVIWVWNGKKV